MKVNEQMTTTGELQQKMTDLPQSQAKNAVKSHICAECVFRLWSWAF